MKKKILLFIFTLVIAITGIVNTYATDKYDGDYTIEYLLRNYNVVTLGTKPRYDYSIVNNGEHEPGSVTNVFDIGGPVLIRGNYTGNSSYDNEFAQKTNCIPSYIKGKMGPNINPGSIEAAELSNIYVGSFNALKNEDGTYRLQGSSNEFNYPIIKSDDYLDFDKLYAAIVNEQKNIDKGIELETDDSYFVGFSNGSSRIYRIEINQPGYYTIDDLSGIGSIFIKNYNPNKAYIITINSEEIYEFPLINVTIPDPSSKWGNTISIYSSDDSVYYGRKGEEKYTGNIIFNIPNARYIYTSYLNAGHIVAPKADVELTESHYPGTIIANSISSKSTNHTAVQFYPYNLDEKISNSLIKSTIKENVELSNDLYKGKYSLDELLKNYSVVTLGQKEYGINTKLSSLTDKKGTANIFHISGQFLIDGNLGVDSVTYLRGFRGVRLDFNKTNKDAASYIKGNLNTNAYDLDYAKFKYFNDIVKYAWQNTTASTIMPYLYVGSNNKIKTWKTKSYENGEFGYKYSDSDYEYLNIATGSKLGPEIRYRDYTLDTVHTSIISDNYINFNVLYDAIVEQQKDIAKGTIVKPDSNNVINIPIGGNYTIEGINEATRINFTNYNDNKNKLTIVTINDEGSINMPFESSDTWSNVMTNDWYGKTSPTYNGEYIQTESYHGNIVFNIPNATYIKMAPGNSFKGHIIAPNADVETPQMNFAGAMIVNSLYSEGYSEAHFYPLTVGSVGKGIELETKTIGDSNPDKVTISGKKTWDDKDNQDGLRPDKVTVNLLANGKKIKELVVCDHTDWKYEFKDLDRTDSNGVKIVYTITENSIDNYATEIEPITDNTCPEGCTGTITGYNITNSYTPKKTSLTVNKVWNDENNKDGIRPNNVEVQLYANGEKVGEPVELTEENNWTHIFNELDMYSKGEKIEYTVKEITEVEGYTIEITGNQEEGYTITNTHIVKEEVKENPSTLDNVFKFTIISIISSIVLVIGVILFTRLRRREV